MTVHLAISAHLVSVASRYFGLPLQEERLHIHIADAFSFLRAPPSHVPAQFDCILVDIGVENHVGLVRVGG